MRVFRAVLASTCLAVAACSDRGPTAPGARPAAGALAAAAFPDVIPLPTGFAPEGIAAGRGSTLFVGSIPSGSIYRIDARTGEGAVLVEAQAGRQASGIAYDASRDRLFVAGGLTGQAYVYDATTGATLATFQLTAPFTTLVNDVVLTKDAAYFTDSFNPVLYRVAVARNGALGAVETIPLTGDYQNVPGQFNGNGIVATPGDRALILVNSATGTLYRVDPETGAADAIELAGGSAAGGDGLVLQGRTLYVVQGFINQIGVVRLSADFASGTVEGAITSDAFRFPSTAARVGSALYVVNARFDVVTPPNPAPGVAFEVVRVPR